MEMLGEWLLGDDGRTDKQADTRKTRGIGSSFEVGSGCHGDGDGNHQI